MGRVIGCQWQFFITVAFRRQTRGVGFQPARVIEAEDGQVTNLPHANLLFRFAHFFAYGLTNPSGFTASSEA